jgi:hypothetical protein
MPPAQDAALAALAAQVKANTDAEASAVIVMNGFAARVDAAVHKALADNPGLQASDLQAITDETTAMKSSADALAAAVVANTPAA